MSGARDVLLGVERSKERARTFGREHTKTQKPEPVTLTLRDELAPTLTVIPSPHPTTVVAPDKTEWKLAAGEGATFEVTSTKEVGTGDDKHSILVWTRLPSK